MRCRTFAWRQRWRSRLLNCCSRFLCLRGLLLSINVRRECCKQEERKDPPVDELDPTPSHGRCRKIHCHFCKTSTAGPATDQPSGPVLRSQTPRFNVSPCTKTENSVAMSMVVGFH